MAKPGTRYIYKSAVTGRIVSKDYADSHKKTTFKERIVPSKPKGK